MPWRMPTRSTSDKHYLLTLLFSTLYIKYSTYTTLHVKPSKNSLKKWTNRVKNNLGDTSYLNKIGSEPEVHFLFLSTLVAYLPVRLSLHSSLINSCLSVRQRLLLCVLPQRYALVGVGILRRVPE